MNEITYTDKVALNENASIPDINKVKANDMNEIKSVVNGNSQISSNNFGLGTNTWTSSATYSIGDIVVYNSNTYKNLTGTNTNITPDQDSTNWEVIPLIVNEKSDSTKNAYSCDYSNKNMIKCKTVTFNPTWNTSTAGGYFSTGNVTNTIASLTNNTILSAYLTPVGVAADYSFFIQEFATDFSQFGMYCSGQAQIILTVFYI